MKNFRNRMKIAGRAAFENKSPRLSTLGTSIRRDRRFPTLPEDRLRSKVLKVPLQRNLTFRIFDGTKVNKTPRCAV